jgi:hypothetical protein
MTDLNTYLACHESHRKDVAWACELNKPTLTYRKQSFKRDKQ